MIASTTAHKMSCKTCKTCKMCNKNIFAANGKVLSIGLMGRNSNIFFQMVALIVSNSKSYFGGFVQLFYEWMHVYCWKNCLQRPLTIHYLAHRCILKNCNYSIIKKAFNPCKSRIFMCARLLSLFPNQFLTKKGEISTYNVKIACLWPHPCRGGFLRP